MSEKKPQVENQKFGNIKKGKVQSTAEQIEQREALYTEIIDAVDGPATDAPPISKEELPRSN